MPEAEPPRRYEAYYQSTSLEHWSAIVNEIDHGEAYLLGSTSRGMQIEYNNELAADENVVDIELGSAYFRALRKYSLQADK